MPRLDPVPQDGRIPKHQNLARLVKRLLASGSDAVIALTDVYTGTREFESAQDAKKKMSDWVGDEPRFYAHAAQYDFEAWLLPFWDEIRQLAGHNLRAPAGSPEAVNHNHPPSKHITEIFRLGRKRSYSKTRDAGKILQGKDLTISAKACPELKAFLNTILRLSGGELL